MTDIRKFLTAIANKEGWDADDNGLAEILTDYGKVIHKGEQDEHRRYIAEERVTEIEGKFIQYTDYIITGDDCMEDMDLSYDLDEAKFVERKERQVTQVYFS